MNVGEQEAAIDQVCLPIRIFRRQNVDLSKCETRMPTSRDGEKLSGTFVTGDRACIRHVTNESRCCADAATQVQGEFHPIRLCALQKEPRCWIECGRQVFEPECGKLVVSK